MRPPPLTSTLFPYTTLFRSRNDNEPPASRYPSIVRGELVPLDKVHFPPAPSFPFATYMPQVWRMDYGSRYGATKVITDRKSTRLNSSHVSISYAVFCLKKKN